MAALIPGDVLARYHRLAGNNVIYVSGTDCHGTPITLRAKKEGREPSEIAEFYHNEFAKSFAGLDFSYDLYSKTSSDFHKQEVQKFILKLLENGFIFEKEEPQDFCPTCNTFLSDREILGTCPVCGKEARGDQCDHCLTSLEPSSLTNKHCATCNGALMIKLNKHLYFKLSAFQHQLENYVHQNKDVWRTNAYNESIKYLEMGLIDRAATRQLNWGINTPVKGYEDKKIYVWIEAVMGYLTAGMQVANEKGWNFNNFLTDHSGLTSYYVHGKDNIPFHTIIFPALLLGMEPNWQLPKVIVSSEYINQNDEKMSKSKGNLVTVNDLLAKFNKDTVRFFFLFNNPEKKDSNFTLTDLILQHNKYLVGVIGNFINRNISYINKKFDGIIKEATVLSEVMDETKAAYEETAVFIEKGEVRAALTRVVDYAQFANKFYDTKQPWVQAHQDLDGFYDTTYSCAYIIANLSKLLLPFIPTSANNIAKVFGIENNHLWEPVSIHGDLKVLSSELLFTRLDETIIA